MLFLQLYLLGAVCVVGRLGWYAAVKLDHYDWRYARSDILGTLFFDALLWPLLLLKPWVLAKTLRNPGRSFDRSGDAFSIGYAFAQQQREWDAIQANPPPCGRYIRHHHYPPASATVTSIVTIEASAAEAEVWSRLEMPNAPFGVAVSKELAESRAHYYRTIVDRDIAALREADGALLRWLAGRDETLDIATDIPRSMDRFEYQAEALARRGMASVFCVQCQRVLAPDELSIHDEEGKPGWNSRYTYCGNGHTVLETRGMHLHYSEPTG